MSIRIFHTGDIHIGMKFNRYTDDVRDKLIEARFNVIDNMIKKSNELSCNIFVIAGDLFNSINIPQKDIRRVVNMLNGFEGDYVFVLPGNHDYESDMNDLWKNFMDMESDKIVFLKDKKPYVYEDIDLSVFPAPCDSKHSKNNAIGWIKECNFNNTKYNIGIAHGAVEGLSPDMQGEYFYMEEKELMDIPVNLWLIGHTHVIYPSNEEVFNHKIYNAGTPEPDGLDYRGDGAAWFIELKDNEINAKKVHTGNYRFYNENYVINSEDDILNLINDISSAEAKNKLMKISLSGNVPKELYSNLKDYYERIRDNLLYVEIDDQELREIIDNDTIEREFTKGSFPYEFLMSLNDDKEALQMAYDLLRRK